MTIEEARKLVEALENFIEAKVRDMNSEHVEDRIRFMDLRDDLINVIKATL